MKLFKETFQQLMSLAREGIGAGRKPVQEEKELGILPRCEL